MSGTIFGGRSNPLPPREVIRSFVNYHNHRGYHERWDNVTPYDVLRDRRQQTLQPRREVKITRLE